VAARLADCRPRTIPSHPRVGALQQSIRTVAHKTQSPRPELLVHDHRQRSLPSRSCRCHGARVHQGRLSVLTDRKHADFLTVTLPRPAQTDAAPVNGGRIATGVSLGASKRSDRHRPALAAVPRGRKNGTHAEPGSFPARRLGTRDRCPGQARGHFSIHERPGRVELQAPAI
jgi:hypothetical protein